MILRTTVETPLGPFTIFSGDAGVVHTHFGEDGPGDGVELDAVEGRRRTAPIRREVEAYFRGALRMFETPADLSDLGAAGAARGGRAAGSALARCPIELFVPCHRVVRAGPRLGSYGRHDERRRFLLRLEGALTDGSSCP